MQEKFLSSKKSIIDANWQHSNLIFSTVKTNSYAKISAQCVKACWRKMLKTGERRPGRTKSRTDGDPDGWTNEHHHTIIRPVWRRAYKNWHKVTTLEFDLFYIKTKSYSKFQLNVSKHVREKCGKLHISSILSSQRGITLSKIDAKRRHSTFDLLYIKLRQVQNFSSICQSM